MQRRGATVHIEPLGRASPGEFRGRTTWSGSGLGAIARDLPCAAIPGGGCRIYGLVHLLDAPIRPRPDAAATSGGAFPDAQCRLVLRAAPGIRSGLAPAI